MTRLVIDGVAVELGGTRIVHGVDLVVGSGEIVGLVGPNGCGKSTLLRSVFRAVRPAAGRIQLGGDDLAAHGIRWVAQRVGVVVQDSQTDFPLTVFDVVLQGRTAHKRPFDRDSALDFAIVTAALETVDLSALKDRPLDHLSGGERQRVFIAQAIAAQPSLLVLDEPLNHLDLHHQHALMHLLGALGTSCLVALHDLNIAARYCDQICLMADGRVVAFGPPADVFVREQLEEVYQVPVTVVPHPEDQSPMVVVR
ncbi:ABC transporter ATP-binding protein [Mariniluteicoccus endophyticus]